MVLTPLSITCLQKNLNVMIEIFKVGACILHGCSASRYVYFKNKIIFFSKMLKTENDMVVSLFKLFSHDELVKLYANFGNEHSTIN